MLDFPFKKWWKLKWKRLMTINVVIANVGFLKTRKKVKYLNFYNYIYLLIAYHLFLLLSFLRKLILSSSYDAC